jgi:membrane protein implicated in regulation of membrane protease activity
MENRRWSSKILLRYFLLQLPGIFFIAALIILLYVINAVSFQVIWIVLAVWVIKDIALYPLVWKSYDLSPNAGKYQMIGQRGVALEAINPAGYILVKGESWSARLKNKKSVIREDDPVYVCDVQGLTLIVRPLTPEEKAA